MMPPRLGGALSHLLGWLGGKQPADGAYCPVCQGAYAARTCYVPITPTALWWWYKLVTFIYIGPDRCQRASPASRQKRESRLTWADEKEP
ncbi:hypothetical protein GQ53DRAFT_746811 [Thozetella sp. PMI_491]|nr:hypothetical protein GQ53DRAFT_746811 [Thozetella sp. PMI_491]